MWRDATNKTLGPRPELIEEIRRRAGVEFFYIYASKAFVEYARGHLKAQIADKTPDTIQDITSLVREFFDDASSSWTSLTDRSHQRIIQAWERRSHKDARTDPLGIFDWIAETEPTEAEGFILVSIVDSYIQNAVLAVLQRLHKELSPAAVQKLGLSHITLVLVGDGLRRSEVIDALARPVFRQLDHIPLYYALANGVKGSFLPVRGLN